MKNDLDEIQEIIEKQNEVLQRIQQSPLETATVVDVSAEFAFINARGSLLRIGKPENIKIAAGDMVAVVNGGGIVDKIEGFEITGKLSTVTKADKNYSEINLDGETAIVRNGKQKPVVGDRVIMDASNTVIMRNLGHEKPKDLGNVQKVDWSEIGGLEDAKQKMIEAIELPFKNPAIYRHYNTKPPKGILLSGPPGCGKTMLGRAASTAIAKIHNSDGADTAFLYVKATELLDKYVGAGEEKIRAIYASARQHKNKHGYPAVIFIDEADAVMGKRATGFNHSSHLVPSFLTELDGMEETAAITILATNRPDMIDPAIVRDGRIDYKIKVTRPTKSSTQDIIELGLNKVPLHLIKASQAAELVTKYIFSVERKLIEIHLSSGREHVTMEHALNGAMLANVVNHASAFAMRRDMTNGKKTGVQLQDLVDAVDHIMESMADIDMDDVVADFVEGRSNEVVSVNRVKQERQQHAEAA